MFLTFKISNLWWWVSIILARCSNTRQLDDTLGWQFLITFPWLEIKENNCFSVFTQGCSVASMYPQITFSQCLVQALLCWFYHKQILMESHNHACTERKSPGTTSWHCHTVPKGKWVLDFRNNICYYSIIAISKTDIYLRTSNYYFNAMSKKWQDSVWPWNELKRN